MLRGAAESCSADWLLGIFLLRETRPVRRRPVVRVQCAVDGVYVRVRSEVMIMYANRKLQER